MRLLALGALLSILTAHSAVVAQTLIDAGTVDVGGQRMLLYGVDVPDAAQSCDDGKWFPRAEGTAALARFVGTRPMNCSQVSFNYTKNMPEALCFVESADLQAFLVEGGWAWVRRPGALKYVDMERRAVQLKRGVHGHVCERADRWQRRNVTPQ
jgi:endonuclease YncB( thermonuclease family)